MNRFLSCLILVLCMKYLSAQRFCGTMTSYLYCSNGIVFSPVNSIGSLENKDDKDIVYCNGPIIRYSINGLQFSEEVFKNFRFKRSDVSGKEGRYLLEFDQNDTNNCAKAKIFALILRSPVYINGELFTKANMVPTQFAISKAASIQVERKRKLFGRDEIRIFLR